MQSSLAVSDSVSRLSCFLALARTFLYDFLFFSFFLAFLLDPAMIDIICVDDDDDGDDDDDDDDDYNDNDDKLEDESPSGGGG